MGGVKKGIKLGLRVLEVKMDSVYPCLCVCKPETGHIMEAAVVPEMLVPFCQFTQCCSLKHTLLIFIAVITSELDIFKP